MAQGKKKKPWSAGQRVWLWWNGRLQLMHIVEIKPERVHVTTPAVFNETVQSGRGLGVIPRELLWKMAYENLVATGDHAFDEQVKVLTRKWDALVAEQMTVATQMRELYATRRDGGNDAV